MAKRISTMTEAEAKQALTILGVDLRGTIGGPDCPFGHFVASRNRYGPYFRRHVVPRDPKNPPQVAQRLAINAVSRLWGTFLTKQQRETWENARIKKTSKFGDRVRLTGQGAWMHLNAMRQRIGLPLIVLPPTSKTAVTFTLPAARLTAPNVLTLRFAADTWNAPGGGIIVSGTAPPRRGVKTWHVFRAIAVLPHPGTVELTLEYPSEVVPGDPVRLRLHATAPSGRQSMVVLQDVIAEAANDE